MADLPAPVGSTTSTSSPRSSARIDVSWAGRNRGQPRCARAARRRRQVRRRFIIGRGPYPNCAEDEPRCILDGVSSVLGDAVLGRSGVTVSRLGAGLAPVGGLFTPVDEAQAVATL